MHEHHYYKQIHFYSYWSSPQPKKLLKKKNSWQFTFRITIFIWLSTAATITLVSKIGVATIQSQPPFDTGKQFLSHYFHNRLWAPLGAVTNWGTASNQVNTVYMHTFLTLHLHVYTCLKDQRIEQSSETR